jgi:hypothetical protein
MTPSTPPTRKTQPKPFPWKSTPPQSLPERLEYATDLEAVLADPALLYETARVAFASALLGLSGAELFELGKHLCQQLRADPTKGKGGTL